MLIDQSYFIGKLNLPQGADELGRMDLLTFINDYEPEYLKKVLGYELWKIFSDEVYDSGATPTSRITALVDGAEFTWEGKLMKWDGFATAPIQYYIYYHFMDAHASTTTLTGVQVAKKTNAGSVAPDVKAITAWNSMIGYNEVLLKFLRVNKADYPEFDFSDCHKEDVFQRKNRLDI